MDTGRKTVRVTIYNQNYALLSTGEPGEVETLAQTVDDLMTDIAKHAGTTDATRLAVLASMHMADRLRTMERELSELKSRVDQKSRQFSMLLDRAADQRG
jgi:cell division protein ZapA (FtsZ GTPase activity inhibitor)